MWGNGAPETIRTSDLPLRRRLLYPAELPGHEVVGVAVCWPGLNRVRSDRCNDEMLFGGAEEDRTPDLCIANAALSQLSYGPVIY